MGIFNRNKDKKINVVPLNRDGVSSKKADTPKTTTKAKPAVKPKTAVKAKPKTIKTVAKNPSAPKSATGAAKDVMIELNKKTNKWVIRTTGSAKALKSFATQKEAIEYGKLIAKNNKSEMRVKSKKGNVRDSKSHRK